MNGWHLYTAKSLIALEDSRPNRNCFFIFVPEGYYTSQSLTPTLLRRNHGGIRSGKCFPASGRSRSRPREGGNPRREPDPRDKQSVDDGVSFQPTTKKRKRSNDTSVSPAHEDYPIPRRGVTEERLLGSRGGGFQDSPISIYTYTI